VTRVAVSWSGGKDSCLACYKALQKGLSVAFLLNFISKDGKCMFHGVNARLIAAQSEAIGIPLIQRVTSLDEYEEEFKKAVKGLKEMGIDAIVFGDIDLIENLNWVIRVCNDVGIPYMEPLWQLDRVRILNEFINVGFEAVVISAKADIFDGKWLGRRVERVFIKDLLDLNITRGVDVCGELGEYHTLVVNGPIFKKRIKINVYNKILGEDYWKRWVLEVTDFTLEGKSLGDDKFEEGQ
jgi:diphthine-ammonia ligase